LRFYKGLFLYGSVVNLNSVSTLLEILLRKRAPGIRLVLMQLDAFQPFLRFYSLSTSYATVMASPRRFNPS